MINNVHTAVLFEYIRNTSCMTFSTATEYYAVGYILQGDCQLTTRGECIKIPENCLYILGRGRHIINNTPDANGVFEQVIMHLKPNEADVARSIETDDDRLEQVVMSAVSENLSLEELADRCYVSVSTFKRHFRRRYSMPPHRWFINRRLDIAYRAVIATDVPITEIAKMCGFPNPSHFISAFKRQYNVTPASLRRSSIHEGAEQVPSE